MAFSFDHAQANEIINRVDVIDEDIADAHRVYGMLTTYPRMLAEDPRAYEIVSREIAAPQERCANSDMAAMTILAYIKNTPSWAEPQAREAMLSNFAFYIAYAYDSFRDMQTLGYGVKM